MRIDHIALWTARLEEMKDFYQRYFQGRAGEKYVHDDFSSYFISFAGGARFELMQTSDVRSRSGAVSAKATG